MATITTPNPASMPSLRSEVAFSNAPSRPDLPFLSLESVQPIGFAMVESPLDAIETREREQARRLRELALPVAEELPTDDVAWQAFNIIRHRLIDRELEGRLSEREAILLGTLETLSNKRMRERGAFSMAKADRLLRELESLEGGSDPFSVARLRDQSPCQNCGGSGGATICSPFLTRFSQSFRT